MAPVTEEIALSASGCTPRVVVSLATNPQTPQKLTQLAAKINQGATVYLGVLRTYESNED